MKKKFSKILGMGLALALILSLVVMAAPASATATAVTDVWVQFTTSTYNKTDTATDFTIHFTPFTDMKRGVDTITVWFPDGSAAMGPDNFDLSSADSTASYYDVDRDGEASAYSAADCISAATLSQSSYRITVTTPVDLDAGTPCSLRIEAAAAVKCADSTSHSQYEIKVYTSQDTHPVASDPFDIDGSAPDSVTVAITPTTAGLAGEYIFTLTLSNIVSADVGTVVFIFPYGTTMPSGITVEEVMVSTDGGSNYTLCTDTPDVNQKARMVTITTPEQLDADGDNLVKFLDTALIKNPQTAKTYTDFFAATSVDELLVKGSGGGFAITAGTATKIVVCDGEIGTGTKTYSDNASMINMYSSQIKLIVADKYGNAKDTSTTVDLTTSGTGKFYSNATIDGKGAWTVATDRTVDAATPDVDQTIFYKGTIADAEAAEPITLTFTDHDTVTPLTTATWTFTVAPAVSLYDSSNNLIRTYGPSTASPTAETGDGTPSTQKYAVDYINDAIGDSFPGDTVKLGDGIYEVDDGYIDIDQKITLTSVSGASSTTIRNTKEIDKAISVGTAGPIVIDNLTFQRLRATVDIDCAVRNAGYDYVTVQNCVFYNIEPDQGAATEGVIWFQNSRADLTSLTISGNIFNDCCTTWPNMGSDYDYSGCIILDFAGGGAYAVSGVTISGNTLTDCGQYGITIGGKDSSDEGSGSVTNNTITNGQCAINVFNNSDSVSITGNKITDAYSYGVYVESTNNANLVIKNNTITGCAGEYYFGGGTTNHGGAIVIEDATSATDPVIQYNTITGSGSYAIKVDAVASAATLAANCKYNWYGSTTGPSYTALTGAAVTKSNPNGTGDSITDQVTYYPWLHKSLADVVDDNASYQASTVKLNSGWNTLSTPVKLMDAANSIGELFPSGLTAGYHFDDSTWKELTPSSVLEPCDAVYVKMSAAKYVLLQFDTKDFNVPEKSLAAGWNLISLAYLAGGMDADDAVASVYETAAGLPGYSQVVSPSLNANQRDIHYTAGTSWTVSSGQASVEDDMFPGLGYWIYMQNADTTLVGFEITPIAPDLD